MRKVTIKSYLLKLTSLLSFTSVIFLVSFKPINSEGSLNDYPITALDVEAKSIYLSGIDLLNRIQYDSALVYFKKASDIFISKQQFEPYIECQLQIAQLFLTSGKVDTAASLLQSVAVNFSIQNINSRLIHAEFLFIKGNLFGKMNDADSSLIYLNQSLELCRNENLDSLIVLVYKSIGNNLLKKNDHATALENYKSALKVELSRNNSSNALIASLYLNAGIANSYQGKYDSANLYFKQSILLKEKYLDKDDPQLASGYLNYGRFLQIMGESIKALDYLNKAEIIYRTNFGNDYAGLAPIYFNIGSIYIVLGEFNQSLTYHERAFELYKREAKVAGNIITDLYQNLGIIHEKFGNLVKAIEYYEMCQDEEVAVDSRIKSMRNSARCYTVLGDFKKAESNLREAVKLSEALYGTDSFQSAGSYSAFGSYNAEIKNYEKAIDLLNKALKIYKDIFGIKNEEVSLVLISIADVYFEQGDFDLSLSYYQEALISAINSFTRKDVFSNPTASEIEPKFNNFVILFKKTNTLYQKYITNTHSLSDLKAGFETNILAIELFEKILASYKDETTKLQTNELVYDIYNLVILIATELYEITGDRDYLKSAFEYSEKGKGAVLLSTMRHSEALTIGKIPDSVKNLEQRISREISYYKNNLFDESQKANPDNNKINSLKKAIFEKSKNYDSLINHLEIDFPEYYRLKYNFKVSAVSEIQNKLSHKEALIEFKVIDSIVISFCVTKDSLFLTKQILEEDLQGSIEYFSQLINAFPGNENNRESFESFIKKGNYLYKLLLSQVVDSSQINSLFIVPDGILGYLSFEALIMNGHIPDRLDFKNLDYVIRQYSVSYLYSATIMLEEPKPEKNNRELLALAPTYSIEKNETSVAKIVAPERMNLLRPLEYSLHEVNAILSSIKGELLSGEEATEMAFKSEANEYCILHFAMHTLVDDEEPLRSKMVFSLTADSVEDGLLNNYEIYNLNLNANLAVLSACKTGMGKLRKGEGIMSLARGFMYAGVPSIIMTLWEIEDISSADIMDRFYKHLKSGAKVNDALRNSKLEYLQSADPLHAHPYFWAAYVQIGDNSPVMTHSNKEKLTYILTALILLFSGVGGYFIRKRLNRKKRFS